MKNQLEFRIEQADNGYVVKVRGYGDEIPKGGTFPEYISKDLVFSTRNGAVKGFMEMIDEYIK